MEYVSLTRLLLSLLFVCGIIGVIYALLRRYGDKLSIGALRRSSTLAVEESLYIDPKHRLVVVRRGEKGYLLLLSSTGDVVVDNNIALPPPKVTALPQKETDAHVA